MVTVCCMSAMYVCVYLCLFLSIHYVYVCFIEKPSIIFGLKKFNINDTNNDDYVNNDNDCNLDIMMIAMVMIMSKKTI